MTLFWPDGQTIKVVKDAGGAPRQFVWRGKRHLVEHVADRWRIDTDWWDSRIWRDYFKVTTDTGLLVILYHDLISSQWYLQRLYD